MLNITNNDLIAAMMQRQSCRAFRSDPVDPEIIKHVLELAQHTASWCNCQPWRVVITAGAGTDRIRHALMAQAESNAAAQPDFPFPHEYKEPYLGRRRESGYQLYNAVGVARGDHDAYRRQALQNFALFNAPHVAFITTDETLGTYGAVDCGGYIANFMLAAQAHGVATIAQASLAMYPDLVRQLCELPAAQKIVAGISFGYADRDHPANGYRTHRVDALSETRWISQ